MAIFLAEFDIDRLSSLQVIKYCQVEVLYDLLRRLLCFQPTLLRFTCTLILVNVRIG